MLFQTDLDRNIRKRSQKEVFPGGVFPFTYRQPDHMTAAVGGGQCNILQKDLFLFREVFQKPHPIPDHPTGIPLPGIDDINPGSIRPETSGII